MGYVFLTQTLTPDQLWLPEFRGLAEDEDEGEDDDADAEDEEEEGRSPVGTWDGAVARSEAAGYGGYPLLAPRLAGDSIRADEEWSLPSEGAVWLSDAVYTRAKAWCGVLTREQTDADTRDRTIRWPDLATANYLINSEP